MGNFFNKVDYFQSNKLPILKGEIIIDDDNDILFNDVFNIKFTNNMNYNEFITRKISLLQNIVNLFNCNLRVLDIEKELKYIHKIEQWESFVLDDEYDRLIYSNFKNFDVFLLENYKKEYINNIIDTNNNTELIKSLICLEKEWNINLNE